MKDRTLIVLLWLLVLAELLFFGNWIFQLARENRDLREMMRSQERRLEFKEPEVKIER